VSEQYIDSIMHGATIKVIKFFIRFVYYPTSTALLSKIKKKRRKEMMVKYSLFQTILKRKSNIQ